MRLNLAQIVLIQLVVGIKETGENLVPPTGQYAHHQGN